MTSNPSEVEVLLKIDSDDKETIDYASSAQFRFGLGILVGDRGNGYADLHLMYNKLCSVSRGRFLFLWNDDATMVTQGWDEQLKRHDDGKPCFVTSQVSDSRRRDAHLFPIVHRSYYETLGHFSMSAHNDTYVYATFKDHPQAFRNTQIVIQHHALQMLDDKTSLEAQQWWPTTKGLWDKPEVQERLTIDKQAIKQLLKQHGLDGVGWAR